MTIETHTLTLAAIREIGDADELVALTDALLAESAQIDAQIEWNSSDDDDWERRAIAALGIKRAQVAECRRQYRRLTGVSVDQQKVAAEQRAAKEALKATRRAALAQEETNRIARKRLEAEQAIERAQHVAVDLIRRHSADAAFRRSARRLLPAEIFDQIERDAELDVAERIKAAVGGGRIP